MKLYLQNYLIKFLTIAFLFFLTGIIANAQTNIPLRRPISPEQPMILIHIDSWNFPDPQKIIDLVPEDIRPYVVMNIALSAISHDVATGRFKVAEYGYEIVKSWLRTCAQNQMWATVQHASGGPAHFSDFDLSIYEEFFIEFPNLLGFNYSEQFWGFDDPNNPFMGKWTDRMAHFANLLELSNQYGGYLVVSWCGNQYNPPLNPIGMLKRNPAFTAACEKYTENYLLFEKYTQQSYQSDMESLCLGAYLSGYSGNFGIRYDESGWSDANGNHSNFTMATGGAPHLERMMLTGATMIDGPELIWKQCFRETDRMSTTNGYTMRSWVAYPQFINVPVDIFRKILDGTVRIPTRQEVIDRTKFVIINDVNSGSSDDIYSSPETLFEGLYRMDGDGNLRNNKSFFKKTGRYPTIPTVYKLNDEATNSFQYKINQSAYTSRWPTVKSKVDEFNSHFPEEYTGNLFAGRHENGWVIYNPFKTNQIASASIPFKYNTCERVDLTFSQYTASVMKEYSEKLTFYLTNYDNFLNTGLKTNVIKIYGSTSEPQVTYTDRGDHQGSIVTSSWSDGVFTLTVKHNGPIDITVDCDGSATDRLTSYTQATLVEPNKPPVYTGPRQYEAESFDYKNIAGITTNGYSGTIRNYTGQGYLSVGLSASAAVRDTVYALRNGEYQLITKYLAPGGDVNSLDLFVNGLKVATPVFSKTANESTWNHHIQSIELKTGKNVIELKANRTASHSLILDNVVITQGTNKIVYHFENDSASTEATTPPAELITAQSGTAGVVEYTDAEDLTSNVFKAYSTGSLNETGIADLDMFNSLAQNYSVIWKEYYNTTGANKGVLIRGSGDHGSCPFAEGLKQGYLFIAQNNNDNTLTLKTFIADSIGLTKKTSFTTSFKVMPDQPCWFRAKAYNDQFLFECSGDSVNWEGGTSATFTDNTYITGSIQLVWGLNSSNFDWVMDNISFFSEIISVSKFSMDNFKYGQGTGPSTSQSFSISGSSLSGDVKINSTENFEVSLNPTNEFGESLNLLQDNDNIPSTTIYVRLKPGLPVEKFSGSISVLSSGIQVHTIQLAGEVTPQPTTLKYDFSDDVATTSAATPPALNTSIGQYNSATAGVVSYTDANDDISNMFKPYSGGQRNATGVVNLDLFPDNATDYSVTWKQHIGLATTEYKIGVLLRGDTENIGTESTGYVQGIMHGYLFIVYNTGSASQFRIYRSSSSYNTLNTLVNTGVGSLVPAPRQPVWYRASVSGTTSVSLSFEYSTDGVNWNIGASTTDNSTPIFTSGATQMVWGLAANNLNFYLDDITYNGLTLDSGTLPEVIEISERFLTGFNYMQGFGPSAIQSFTVSGDSLTDHIEVSATAAYEVSLDATQGFAQSVVLQQNNGKVVEIPVYVRMKSDLIKNTYSGEVTVSSRGVASRIVSLTGTVDPGPEITVSTSVISGYLYKKGFGPSGNQSFTVSGSLLFDDIIVTSPENYEMTLGSGANYSSTITLNQSNGEVLSTRIYVRLKSDLEADAYDGDVVLNSSGATTQTISLSGTVWQPTGVSDFSGSEATVISTQYYTITGQKVNNIEHLNGVFIVRKMMSDGSITTSKVWQNWRSVVKE